MCVNMPSLDGITLKFRADTQCYKNIHVLLTLQKVKEKIMNTTTSPNCVRFSYLCVSVVVVHEACTCGL